LFTIIKVVGSNGQPTKAEVNCGGSFKGFTNERTDELSFELSLKDSYRVSIKKNGNSSSGQVYGGKTNVLRV